MIEEDAVRWAYRLIMGREAESEAVVKAFAQNYDSIPALRRDFMLSAEFRALAGFTLRIPNSFSVEITGSPKIFVISNCQGPEIARHLSCITGLPAAGRDVSVYAKGDVAHWYADCERADLIVAASLSDQFEGLQLHQLHARYPGKVFTIMPPFFEGLFPDAAALGRLGERVEGPMGIHSKLIVRSYLLGHSREECKASFNGKMFEQLGYFDAWERSAAEFRRRDESADIRIADRFFDQLKEIPLLLTNNHPTAGFYRIICEQIASFFNLPYRDVPVDITPSSHAFTPSWPIWDRIAEYFELKYRTPQIYTRELVAYDLDALIAASYEAYATLDRAVLLGAAKARGTRAFDDLPEV